MTLLDDLLTYEDEPRRGRHKRGVVFRLVISVLVTGAISWFIWVLLGAMGISAPFVFLFSALLTLAALRAVLAAISPPDLPPTLRDVPTSARSAGEPFEDGMRAAVRRWESRLDWTHQDPQRFSTVVQTAAADIVDERLRQRHGVSLRGDPSRAEQLIPPQLWKFIHQPVSRSVTPQELATLVAQMEAL